THEPLPRSAADALANATDVTLYSLDDTNDQSDGSSAVAAGKLHRFPVLGKTVLTGKNVKKAVAAFQDAIARSTGPRYACFEPHHALRIVSGDHTYDYLLCYDCSAIVVYQDDKEIQYQSAAGSPAVLNELLREAHVPLADKYNSGIRDDLKPTNKIP